MDVLMVDRGSKLNKIKIEQNKVFGIRLAFPGLTKPKIENPRVGSSFLSLGTISFS
jgi:hypothetical protein